MYFAAVLGIFFPGIPGAVISFSPFCLIYSLSNPPGKDASSISKTSLLKASNSSFFIIKVGTVLITMSNLDAKLITSGYVSGINLFS